MLYTYGKLGYFAKNYHSNKKIKRKYINIIPRKNSKIKENIKKIIIVIDIPT